MTSPASTRRTAAPRAGRLPVLVAVAAAAIAAGLAAMGAAVIAKTALYVIAGGALIGVLAFSIRDLLTPHLREAIQRLGASRFPARRVRPPSPSRSIALVGAWAAGAGIGAWWLAQQGTKAILALVALLVLAAVAWLAWPLLMLLVQAPQDSPPRPRRFDQAVPATYSRRARATGLALTAMAAGALAWVAAQLGLKGLIGLMGAIAVAATFLIVRNRTLFFTFATVCSLTVLFHKSFGPQDLQLSGGAPAVYITTFDALLVLLYAVWISEGTFVADLRAAARRRILWLPLVGAMFLLPSLLVATSPGHALSELVRMSWMYLLFFYLAVRIRTRAMVWAVLGGLTFIAAIEFVVVVLQWKTGGVLGLSFLGVPTQLTERTTDTTTIGRPFGTIIHPVFMGATVGSLSLMGLAVGLSFRRSLVKVAALSVAALSLLPLYLAHTRAALVAWVMVAAAVVLIALTRRLLAWSTVGRAIVIALLAVAVFWPQLVRTFEENFSTGHFSEEVDSRRQLNDLAGAMIADHPVLGVGLNNFEVVMGPYEKYGIIFFDNPVHNLYLLYLSETGAVGLVGLLVVGIGIYNVPIRLARSNDPLFRGVGLGVAAVMGFMMIEELLGFSLRQDVPLALFWILAGLAVACSRMAGFEGSRDASSRRRWRLDGARASRVTSATRSPRPTVPSGATPQLVHPTVRTIPKPLSDLVASMEGEPASPAPRSPSPCIHPGETTLARPARVGRTAVAPAPALPTRHNRPRWQLALWSAMAVSVLSAGMGGAGSPSGAAAPFELPQLKIVIVARARLDANGVQVDPSVSPLQGIYVASGDGSGLHEILSPPDAGVTFNWAQWALGGTKILYTVRDGPRVKSAVGDNENLWIMDADGSNPRQLTGYDYRAVQPKMSPDGRSVIFSATNPQFPRIAVYHLDLVTGLATNLSQVTQPNGALDSDPKWAPDGRILVASTRGGATQVNRFDANGANRQALTNDSYYNTDPEGSPANPDLVAYSSYRGSKIDLRPPNLDGTPNTNPDDTKMDPASWIITVKNSKTGAETHLTRGVSCVDRYPTNPDQQLRKPCTPGESSGWKPVWTPDGNKIGFDGIIDSKTACICVANADGTGSPQAIIQSSSLLLTWFDWTVPDPTRIPSTATPASAYLSRTDNTRLLISATSYTGTPTTDIRSEPVDMMGQRNPLPVASDPMRGIPSPIQGSWNSNRTMVVFVGDATYDLNNPTPGPAPPAGQTRREHATISDLQPALAPRHVVDGSGALKQVFLAKADGSIRQVTNPWTEDWRDGVVSGDARANTDPVISPDGRYVVFTNHSTLTDESFLVRMDLTTGEVLNLTNGTAGAQRVNDASPRWSPDSSRIAFSWTQGTSTDIYVMRAADGMAVTHVTDDGATDISPAWSPDGRSIVFSHHEGNLTITAADLATLTNIETSGWTLVRVDVASGMQTRLTGPADSPAFKPAYSPDGSRIYFIGMGPSTFDIHQVDPAGSSPPSPVLITPFINETSIDWR